MEDLLPAQHRPAAFARPVSFRTRLHQVFARYRLRKILARDLRFAPDAVLKDAGYTRASLEKELRKPVWRA